MRRDKPRVQRYIQCAEGVDAERREDISLFYKCMTELHCRHLQADIDQYERSTDEEVATIREWTDNQFRV